MVRVDTRMNVSKGYFSRTLLPDTLNWLVESKENWIKSWIEL